MVILVTDIYKAWNYIKFIHSLHLEDQIQSLHDEHWIECILYFFANVYLFEKWLQKVIAWLHGKHQRLYIPTL